ncbi:MAG: transcriptional regulator Anr [Gammaproteobacteria bacterium]|nr:MAG: transcriptional regulator Anr [Gammaproteobacteria bacterium]
MNKKSSASVINLKKIRAACRECSLRELCLPLGLADSDISSIEKIIKRTRNLKKGEFLYCVGDPLEGLYAIRAGSIKTSEITREGHIQITGFHLPGELLGVDAISDDLHPCDAVALESTVVCEIPLDDLEELARKIPGLQKQLLRVMSREIVQDETLLLMLGKMNADARLAACLVNFSERFKKLGFSGSAFKLTMSRQDLGDYLGLALETVSRLFTRFQEEGYIKVEGRQLELLDIGRLRTLMGDEVELVSKSRPVA